MMTLHHQQLSVPVTTGAIIEWRWGFIIEQQLQIKTLSEIWSVNFKIHSFQDSAGSGALAESDVADVDFKNEYCSIAWT